MSRRIAGERVQSPPAISPRTPAAVVQWIRSLRSSSGHDPLYDGFDRIRSFICRSSGAVERGIASRDVFAALAYEVSFVVRSYERHGSRDVFTLDSKGARYGMYELDSTRQFVGECGGPHQDRVLVIAPAWRHYLRRCIELLQLLIEEGFLVMSWPETGLSQEESDWLCEPLARHVVEGHRGAGELSSSVCWMRSKRPCYYGRPGSHRPRLKYAFAVKPLPARRKSLCA